MEAEFLALENTNTWATVDLPPRKKDIKSKWVLKVKQRTNGTVKHCEASSRQWYEKLSSALKSKGHMSYQNDHSLFSKSMGSLVVYVAVYVDGILVTSNNLEEINNIKTFGFFFQD
ncbi:uncharacterized protein LOC143559448 [Bidens hawaiensis]|uniref:uncharacterized protein LOC143559448 n=1 Tax=Bidens hawaiensis TaxID=980011 RepID=UPI00404AAF09